MAETAPEVEPTVEVDAPAAAEVAPAHYIQPSSTVYAGSVVAASPAVYSSPPVTYSAAPVTYSAPPVTYSAAPVTYSAAPVTYSAAPVTYAAAPVTYSAAPTSSVVVAQPVSTTTLPSTYTTGHTFVTASGSSIMPQTGAITYAAPPIETAGTVPWPVASTSIQYSSAMAFAPQQVVAAGSTVEQAPTAVSAAAPEVETPVVAADDGPKPATTRKVAKTKKGCC